jgi:L-cysteate sulfo-lyase
MVGAITEKTVSEMLILPRVTLAKLPTPIEPLPRFSKALGGPEIWVKRDDLTGLATGGNKTRKLEYLLGAAAAEGADCVITAGSTQSNHTRQTAAAARRAGIEPHLVLYAPEGKPPKSLEGNVLIDHLLGAMIHWTDERAPYSEALADVEKELRDAGKKPYVIPYGGSNAVGIMGYVTAMREVESQVVGEGWPLFDTHVFASSSGGTQAGLILGAQLGAALGKIRLLGISVDESRVVLTARVTGLVNAGARRLGLDWRVGDDVVEVNDDYLGAGYAVIGDPEREAIRLLAETEGLLADPVYTGRALAGMIDLIRKKRFNGGERILFWHTGGQASIFAFGEELLGRNAPPGR